MSGFLTTGCDWLFSDEEEDIDLANYADWYLLKKQYTVLDGFPDFSGQITFLDYHTDQWAYQSVTISTPDKYADNYMKVLKKNSFVTSTAKHTYKTQLMSSNRIGAYWRYVGFDNSDYPGYTNLIFFSIK